MNANQMDDFNAAAPAVVQVEDKRTVTEEQFRPAWISILSRAMLTSGKGFRVDSPNRKPRPGASGWHGERRADKPGTTKLERRLLAAAR